MRRRLRHRWSRLSVFLAFTLVGSTAVTASADAVRHASNSVQSKAVATPPSVPLFVHYYLWWDAQHWRSKLGSQYPTNTRPLPASLAADGCHAATSYRGNQLIDVPNVGLYSEDNPATVARQVQEAANAGVNGFVVSWSGTGQLNQRPKSRDFDYRLAILAFVVAAHNATSSKHFSLMLGYEGLDNSRKPRPTSSVRNDLDYFARAYAASPVFHVAAYGAKPVVVFLDSGSYSTATLRSVLTPLHSKLTLIGDERGVSHWNRGVSSIFDGDSWYWSSENPYSNPGAFAQLSALSRTLHAQHKLWFSPLSAGYDRANFGTKGSCVPRNGTQTLRRLYTGNAASRPDGWMFISWNEYFENTYVEPSVRYGSSYLDALGALRGR